MNEIKTIKYELCKTCEWSKITKRKRPDNVIYSYIRLSDFYHKFFFHPDLHTFWNKFLNVTFSHFSLVIYLCHKKKIPVGCPKPTKIFPPKDECDNYKLPSSALSLVFYYSITLYQFFIHFFLLQRIMRRVDKWQ